MEAFIMNKFKYAKLGRNDLCWCGSGKKYKNCHDMFDEKARRLEMDGYFLPDRSLLKTPEEIRGIRESAKINIEILDIIAQRISVGMSTEDIDKIVYEETVKRGAIPAPLNFCGYPKSVCTSLNDEVCHGIPDKDIIIQDGDIINVDCSTIYNGYFSDSSRMFCLGDVHPEMRRLVDVTKECVEIGIKHVIPWTPIGDMGHAVHLHALENGYTVVKEIGGHGIGKEFHEEPFVSYTCPPGTGMLMVPGLCFTIEPMVNMGGDTVLEDADNGWTVFTEDGYPSAQWEVQVVVTEDGCEVLAY
jgi:methionyl aminopeptidase